jgi:hypothetical protein
MARDVFGISVAPLALPRIHRVPTASAVGCLLVAAPPLWRITTKETKEAKEV